MKGYLMKTIELDDDAIAWLGCLDLERGADGFTPRRLPAWTRPHIPDVFMDAMVSMASGVRLSFVTTSAVVELDVLCSSFRWSDQEMRPIPFQLIVDGERTLHRVTYSANCFVINRADQNDVSFETGEKVTLRFDGLGDHPKSCELWLPHTATVELQQLRVDDHATVSATPRTMRRWLHHGSSISHCMEADTPTGTWPAVAAKLARVELLNLGFAGQCHLDQFVARTIRDQPVDVISLKLGINIINADSLKERTFGPAANGFLDTIREGQPNTPILVVSPICCPPAESHPGPTLMMPDGGYDVVAGPAEIRPGSLTLQRVRELLAALVAGRQIRGDANLHYLDGLSLFGFDDVADLPDRLHPNPAGYYRMGERFAALAFGPGGPLAEPIKQ
jgi:hypothetical protein